jgi:N-carbamoylputrescine amidase
MVNLAGPPGFWEEACGLGRIQGERRTVVKIAGIQICCSEAKERNIEKAVKFAEVAGSKGANIVCFQELFSTHWFPRETDPSHLSLAEPIDGPTILRMQEVARKQDLVLICPFFEKEGESFFNSAAVIDAGGEIVGTYRKNHVPQIPLWEERYYFARGNLGFPVFRTKYAVLGVQICWDNFFPEGARILTLKGAQILFAPTAAAFASHRRWETVIASHAIANGVYILRVNRVGSEEKQDFYGNSFCVSPDGELLDQPAGMKEGIVLVEVDLKQIEKVRKDWPFFKDRRPEVYTELLSQPTP